MTEWHPPDGEEWVREGDVKIAKCSLRMIQLWPDGSEYPRYEWVRDHTPHGVRVLDVGCNSGQILRNLEQDRQTANVGVDIDAEFVEFARSRGGATYHVMAAEHLTERLLPESFDVVLALEVLEHVPSLRPTLAAMIGVLKPGGLLLVTVPMPHGLTGYRFMHDWPTHHVRIFTRWRLQTALEAMGLMIEDYAEIEKIGHGFMSMGMAARK